MGLGHSPCAGLCEREPDPRWGPCFWSLGVQDCCVGWRCSEGLVVTVQGIGGRGLCGKGKKCTFSYLVAIEGGSFSNPCRWGSTGEAYSSRISIIWSASTFVSVPSHFVLLRELHSVPYSVGI